MMCICICIIEWHDIQFCWSVLSVYRDRIGCLSPEQVMPSITWPLHPPPPLQLSNQPVLICYNKSPSGPYYSNPCDVISKQHCFLSSERRTTHYLTTDGGIFSLFLLLPSFPPSNSSSSSSTVPPLSVTAAQRRRTGPSGDCAVGSLHQQQACGQSRCSYQHKQWTERLLGCEKEYKYKQACVRASAHVNSFWLVRCETQEVWGALLLAHAVNTQHGVMCHVSVCG